MVAHSTHAYSKCRYLDNSVVFVGSAFGDSQLVRLSGESVDGSYLTVLESYSNVGPIVDMVVMDLDRHGQGQVVTCSGAGKDGSLRIIRSGIGIYEQATIDLPGIKGLWALRAAHGDRFDRFLVQSYIGETRVCAITGVELKETSLAGFQASTLTLHCGNLAGDFLVQVTQGGARLVRGTDGSLAHAWTPPGGARVTVAAGSDTHVALATSGGAVYLLGVVAGALAVGASRQLEHEVSCLAMGGLGAGDGDGVDVDMGGAQEWLVVGHWTDNSVWSPRRGGGGGGADAPRTGEDAARSDAARGARGGVAGLRAGAVGAAALARPGAAADGWPRGRTAEPLRGRPRDGRAQ